MKKTWKKILSMGCAAVMLMMMPGMCVLADDMTEEEIIVTDAEDPEGAVDTVDLSVEDVAEVVEENIDQEEIEEVVGEGPIQVGDGVTATFDTDTGAVEFTSQNGELWRDWVDKLGVGKSEIKSIRVESGTVYLPADSSGYYYDNDKYTEFYYLFCNLYNLKSLDLSSFDTSNVTSMSYMFAGCSSLTNLDLSSFNTSNVTDMNYMFLNCKSLTNLDLSSFDTSNVTSMSYMFEGCSSLTNLDLSSFNTSNVTDMNYMFFTCKSLTNLDLSSFDTSNVTDMRYMFYNCEGLTNLDLSIFNTSNVTDMRSMFRECESLTNLDLSSFDIANVTDMNCMFMHCNSLTNLDLSSFDMSNVTDMSDMFYGCESLTNLDLSSFDTSNVTSMWRMFYGCDCLTNLDLSSFDTSNVTDMSSMFAYCESLTNLDLSNFSTGRVKDMSFMFGLCTSLTYLDLSSFDISNVTDMGAMFQDCNSLTNLDLSSFDTSNVEDMRYMFSGCNSLQILYTPKKNYHKGILLYNTMYDLVGNEYSNLPVGEGSLVLTKSPINENLILIEDKVIVKDEKNEEYEEEISFRWGVEKLEYSMSTYDYDLAIAAAYLSSGTYYGEDITFERMKNLGFESLDRNHPYDEENNSVPWMAIGYQKCSVNGIEKKIVCLNVRGTKFDSEWDINIKQGWGEGFVPVGKSAFDFLSVYCEDEDHSINLNDPNTILFLTGHSLGGATAARLAMDLDSRGCKGKVITYTFGAPNYACHEIKSKNNNIHTVWNEGDPVACLGGIASSHAGQIIKFSRYIRYNKENALNGMYHEMDRYMYRTIHSEGKMSGLGSSTLNYVFHVAEDELFCPVPPDPGQELHLGEINDFGRGNSNKLGTKVDFHCPVNVRIYNSDNTLVGDSTNGNAMFTDGSGGYIYLVDDAKCVFLPVGSNYQLDISGYADGMMNIEAMEIDLFGEKLNSVTYENISIENEKQFILDSHSENTVEESELFVVKKEESVPIAVVQTDGTELPLLGSGVLCEGVTWSVDTTGELTIHGSGGIPSFPSADDVPWSGLSEKITSVTVSDGITIIGSRAFSNLVNLKTSKVASTVTRIDANAFAGCTGMESVLFYGDMPTIARDAFKDLSLSILYYSGSSTWNDKPDLGEGIQYCGYCGFNSEGLELEHSFVTETIEPSNDHFGYTLYYCDTCGYAYATDFVGLKKNIADCTITLSNSSYTYNGSARKPTVTVKDGESVLTSGTDYTVTYANNKNAGTATVTVTGKGSYIGTASKTFKINKAAAKLVFADASISKKTTDATFTNTLTKTTDGTVTFSSSDTKIAEVNSTSGLVTIKGAGAATITASAAEGTNYKAGSASYTLIVEAPAPGPAVTGFSDVQDPTHPYYDAIYWAAEKGITGGYKDGTFGINKACTRGHAVMFLWKMAGAPAPAAVTKTPFSDVPKTHPYYKAVLWAQQKGITKGYTSGPNKGKFGINDTCTRGQIMTFIWNYKRKPAPKSVSKSPFSDVPTSHPYYKAILWGSQNGVTKGYTTGPNAGKFGINDNCTRGQIVKFLYNIR